MDFPKFLDLRFGQFLPSRFFTLQFCLLLCLLCPSPSAPNVFPKFTYRNEPEDRGAARGIKIQHGERRTRTRTRTRCSIGSMMHHPSARIFYTGIRTYGTERMNGWIPDIGTGIHTLHREWKVKQGVRASRSSCLRVPLLLAVHDSTDTINTYEVVQDFSQARYGQDTQSSSRPLCTLRRPRSWLSSNPPRELSGDQALASEISHQVQDAASQPTAARKAAFLVAGLADFQPWLCPIRFPTHSAHHAVPCPPHATPTQNGTALPFLPWCVSMSSIKPHRDGLGTSGKPEPLLRSTQHMP